MNRSTTLHGTFKCDCGWRSCIVGNRYIKCARCRRLYRFREYLDMLDETYGQMLLEAGHEDLAEGA